MATTKKAVPQEEFVYILFDAYSDKWVIGDTYEDAVKELAEVWDYIFNPADNDNEVYIAQRIYPVTSWTKDKPKA